MVVIRGCDAGGDAGGDDCWEVMTMEMMTMEMMMMEPLPPGAQLI